MIREGTDVEWNWGNGKGKGKVMKVYHSTVTKVISGQEIKRKASKDEPAYLIEQEDGEEVLKSASEISRV